MRNNTIDIKNTKAITLFNPTLPVYGSNGVRFTVGADGMIYEAKKPINEMSNTLSVSSDEWELYSPSLAVIAGIAPLKDIKNPKIGDIKYVNHDCLYVFVEDERGLKASDNTAGSWFPMDSQNTGSVFIGYSDNVAENGVATASVNDGELAFNNIETNGWNNDNVASSWIAYDFGVNKKKISKYSLYRSPFHGDFMSDFFSPASWKIEGSNDGNVWEVLDVRKGESISLNSTSNQFLFTNNKAFQFYKISDINSKYNSLVNITKIGFYEKTLKLSLGDSDGDTRIQFDSDHNADNINFYISDVPKMILAKNGFLGVGITSPTVAIDVKGGFKVRDSATPARIDFSKDNGDNRVSIGTNRLDDTLGTLGVFNANNILWSINKNFQVGHNSPFVQEFAYSCRGIVNDGKQLLLVAHNHIIGHSINSTFDGTFNINNFDGALETNQLTILGNGNIGIGESTPTDLLHVNGDIRITKGIKDSKNSLGDKDSVLSSIDNKIEWVKRNILLKGMKYIYASFDPMESINNSTMLPLDYLEADYIEYTLEDNDSTRDGQSVIVHDLRTWDRANERSYHAWNYDNSYSKFKYYPSCEDVYIKVTRRAIKVVKVELVKLIK